MPTLQYWSGKTTDRHLKFDIAAPPLWQYAQDDTIIGNLVRSAEIVTPEASVTLWLRAHAKTTIDTENMMANPEVIHMAHKHSLPLVDEQVQILHAGPMHIAPDSGEKLDWPFSVQLSHASLKKIEAGVSNAGSLIPLDQPDDPGHFILPGTFSTSERNMLSRSSASIEYELGAKLRYKYGGEWKVDEVTLPLKVRFRPRNMDMLDKVRRSEQERIIQSPRLLPDMKDLSLSLKQRTQKFFSSSKIPTLWVKFIVDTPAAVQLDSAPISFTIDVVPVKGKTSEELIDKSNIVRIEDIKVSLSQTTSVRMPASLNKCYFKAHSYTLKHDLCFEKPMRQLGEPIDFDIGKGSAPIDLGEKFQLVFMENGLYSNGQRLVNLSPLYPSFKSYTITCAYTLQFEVIASIAGKSMKCIFRKPVEIIAQ